MHPLLILAIGIFSIIFLITVLRLNAFIALIVSAILVSLLAPGERPTRSTGWQRPSAARPATSASSSPWPS